MQITIAQKLMFVIKIELVKFRLPFFFILKR